MNLEWAVPWFTLFIPGFSVYYWPPGQCEGYLRVACWHYAHWYAWDPKGVYWRSRPPTTESQTKVRLNHQGHNPVFLKSHFVCMQSTKRLTSSYMTTKTSGSLIWNPHINGTHSVIFQTGYVFSHVCLSVCLFTVGVPTIQGCRLGFLCGPWPCPSSVQGPPPGHVQTFSGWTSLYRNLPIPDMFKLKCLLDCNFHSLQDSTTELKLDTFLNLPNEKVLQLRSQINQDRYQKIQTLDQ